MRPLTVGSLFSGIGGIDLGLERAGMRVVWHSEIDLYASRVLAKHWPTVPNLGDITKIDFTTVEPVDVLAGGFPCQDISVAGKGAGIDGERSGLWREYARAIRDLRPRYVLVENVPALLGRGLCRVLGNLAPLGYDAQWDCISAADVGAPHIRNRVWIVAHANGPRLEERVVFARSASGAGSAPKGEVVGLGHQVADANEFGARPIAQSTSCEAIPTSRRLCFGPRRRSTGTTTGRELFPNFRRWAGYSGQESVLADAAGPRRHDWAPGAGGPIWDGARRAELERFRGTVGGAQWSAEPDVGRVADGVPSRVDRLRGLGNAVVPQIPELIGGWIVEHARQHSSVGSADVPNGKVRSYAG